MNLRSFLWAVIRVIDGTPGIIFFDERPFMTPPARPIPGRAFFVAALICAMLAVGAFFLALTLLNGNIEP